MNRISSRKAFTLVELLVVMAVVTILSGLLLPVLGKARGRARQSNCLGNLRQQGVALQLYIGDYDFLPVQQNREYGLICWRRQLGYYAGGWEAAPAEEFNGIFRCPEWENSKLTNPLAEEDLIYGGGYGWNWEFLGLSATGSGGPAPYELKPHRANRPSLTVAIGDTVDWPRDGNAYLLHHCGIFRPTFIQLRPPVGDRHRKGVHFLFLDGHAARQSQQEAMIGVPGRPDYYFILRK